MDSTIDKERHRRLILPIALGAALTWLAVVALAFYAAWSGTSAMEAREKRLAQSAIDSETDRLAGWASDYAWWDDAIQNLVLQPNDTWADENIGSYLYDNRDVDASFVVNRDGSAIIGFEGGKQTDRTPTDMLGGQLETFLRISDELSSKQPFAARGLVKRGDAIYVVVASTFMAETQGSEMEARLGDRRAMLVLVRELDSDLLDELARRFQLVNLSIRTNDPGSSAIPLVDVDGTIVAYLEWEAENFGRAFGKVVALPVIAAILVTALFVLLFSRRVRDLLVAQAETARAREKAEAATQVKSDFLTMISHDITTPLNGVIGLGGVLLTTKLSNDQRQMVEAINTSGQALLDMIGDVIDFARIETGDLAMEEGLFEAIPLVDSLVETVSTAAQGKGLELSSYVAPELSAVSLSGDEARVRQILLNLLNNAVKFTDLGSVWIEATLVGPGSGQEPPSVRFTVGDTGFGIAPERQAHLFDQTGTRPLRRGGKGAGLGLGLAIAKRLVAAMGGRIGVNSELGSGSTFWIELPLGVVGTPAQTVTMPLRLLAALPDTLAGELTGRQLADWGVRLDPLRGSEGGDATVYDGVLVDDSCMEEAEWRALAGSNRMRVLLLTDRRQAGEQDTGGPGGAVRVLRKPLRLSNLLSSLGGLSSARHPVAAESEQG